MAAEESAHRGRTATGTCGCATIAHETRNGRVYACLPGLAPLAGSDAASLPPTYNKPGLYDVREGRCEGFDRLPAWLQEQAMESRDWAATANARSGANLATANGAGTRGKAPARRPRERVVPRPTPEAAARFDTAGGFDSMSGDIPF
ncbi:hypothetical protein [Paraburkholderia ferrariae]|uniref:hypothetical protein n=1 Tax=Paraburkholderia ferrariae TaxID=386056 RepID=UPI0004810168|nr:hypothetical protein [Paraburkholderia ferrariae]